MSVTEISRDAGSGKIVIDVRGTSATPSTKPTGDTTVEAKLDGHVCGSAQAVVIVPDAICGPCPSSTSSSSNPSSDECPPGSQVEAENKVLDSTTSPAYFGALGADQVKLATIWPVWVSVGVCDQFGDAVDGMYGGCCVEEFVGGKWHRINQAIDSGGKYLDPVGPFRQPSTAIVNRVSQAATDWPTDSPLSMLGDGCHPQDIPVRICGHEVGGMARQYCYRAPDCAWVVCPDGTVITN